MTHLGSDVLLSRWRRLWNVQTARLDPDFASNNSLLLLLFHLVIVVVAIGGRGTQGIHLDEGVRPTRFVLYLITT